MLDNDHECFSPPSENCTLWRYMDLTKFLSLLENQSLYLPRADQLFDPYEGMWSRGELLSLGGQTKHIKVHDKVFKQLLNVSDLMKRQVYISCWFVSEYESAAMWKLYLQSSEGIAIKTDYESFTDAIDNSPLTVRTTMVKYIDYEKEYIPVANRFYPFTFKRLSFAHENELRAIVWSKEKANIPLIPDNVEGVEIKINTDELIHSVHVSPTAPKWFGQLVEKLLNRYELTAPVICSSLYDRPSY